MTVQKFARKDVKTASMETTVRALAQQMKAEGVGSIVVVSDAKPVGIVTDRDLVVYALATDGDPETMTARDVMSEDIFTVDADADVFAVVNRMADAGVRRVPVVENTELVGIVTLDDLVVVLANELNHLAEVIETEMPPYAKPPG
ncbi:CBS domain-containing protein [Halorarius litoreus]|uniref:CBS domain-containing protein n=1 Tax=Halorarius litoreus TaxID=2962676 RepID=UPI0020CCAF27|nr:CBS domain-containing protein [Halorarius litoreus]